MKKEEDLLFGQMKARIEVFLRMFYRSFTSRRSYHWSRLFCMLDGIIQNWSTFLMSLNELRRCVSHRYCRGKESAARS